MRRWGSRSARPARIVGGSGSGQVPCLVSCPSNKCKAAPSGELGGAGIDQAYFRLMIPTRRDIQIVICVPSDPAPWSLWPTVPHLACTPPPPRLSFFPPPPPPPPTTLLDIAQPSYCLGGVKSCIVPATLGFSVEVWCGAAVRGWSLFGPQSTPTLACECCPTNQALCEALRRLNLRRVFAAKVIKQKEQINRD